MTKDDIIRMARESECEETFGTDSFRFTIEDLERFTNLVAASEREACAKLCAGEWNGDADTHEEAEAYKELAAAIRARTTP